MSSYPPAAKAYDTQMRRISIMALAAGRRSWRRAQAADLSGTWQSAVEGLVPLLTSLQGQAAVAGAGYVADALAEQGVYRAPDAFVAPAAFAGAVPDGRSLAGLLYQPVVAVKTAIGGGVDVRQALQLGGRRLDRMVQTLVADTGRAAAGADIASRPGVGWVRMLNPPSCSRCAILAGKWFRWNQGFLRHPGCDCRHIPSTENVAGDTVTDPYEYFHSLTPEQQAKQFTKAGAQAINDGADMFQVVNSRRGMTPNGMKTNEGMSKRGAFYQASGGHPVRLTPEAIYKLNGANRAGALKDLEKYGYVLPGGQNPLGVLVGQREGFGALGRGGADRGAADAVLAARRAGVQDPGVRAVMTEAQRRLFDAKLRWAEVQAGRNPLGRGPLTPRVAALVEKDYRRWIATGGEVFGR